MVHSDLLVSFVAALVAAFVGGFAAARLRLPPIIGYLLAGVVIGPFTPGFTANPDIAAELAEVGVILLMFGVGIHFSLRDLLAVRSIALPGAIGQITVATGLGVGLALWWGWELGPALVLGLAVSVASTVVLLRALEDRGALDSSDGHAAIGWLIVEDLFTVIVLVLLPALAGPLGGDTATGDTDNIAVVLALALVKAVAFVLLMLVVGARVIPWVLVQVSRTGSRELFTLSVLAVAMGIALGAAVLFDVSLALGAFLAGVVVGESDFSHQAAADALPMRDAFAVLFFVSVGMLLDPAVLIDQPGQVLGVLAIIVIGKSAAAFGIVAVLGYPSRTGLTVAAGLAQIGEFSFILATMGRSLGLFTDEGTNLVLAGALLSITMNPLLFAAIEPVESLLRTHPRLANMLSRRTGGRDLPAQEPGSPAMRDHTIVCGYGRVGWVVVEALHRHGITCVVIDQNRRLVETLRDRGIPALFGDAARPHTLDQSNLMTARALIVALGDAPATRQIVAYARTVNPRLDVIARTHSDGERRFLRDHGVDEAVFGEREAALEIARHVLTRRGIDAGEVQTVIARLRDDGARPAGEGGRDQPV